MLEGKSLRCQTKEGAGFAGSCADGPVPIPYCSLSVAPPRAPGLDPHCNAQGAAAPLVSQLLWGCSAGGVCGEIWCLNMHWIFWLICCCDGLCSHQEIVVDRWMGTTPDTGQNLTWVFSQFSGTVKVFLCTELCFSHWFLHVALDNVLCICGLFSLTSSHNKINVWFIQQYQVDCDK